MEFTAQQIAAFLHGTIEGNPLEKVSDFSKIEEGKPGTLSFLSNPKYTHYIYESNASIILVNNDFVPEQNIRATLIRVENAYESLAELLSLVEQYKQKKVGISPLAYIAESAKIGENAYIAPFVYVGENVIIGKNASIHSSCTIEDNVVLGENTTLYAGVKIYNDCKLGNNCILHAGAVIGSDGFGFAPKEDGTYKKIPQTGNVILEDNVEIGANTTIDRATLGSTILHSGVKIDNLVQIAHNVEIGENTVIAAQTGISGSTKIGKHCTLAGQAGLAGHIHITDGTIIAAQTGVANSVKRPGQILMGSPAFPLRDFQRSSIVFKSLPELQRMIYAMQQKIEELERKI